jgi:hypothetical protein
VVNPTTTTIAAATTVSLTVGSAISDREQLNNTSSPLVVFMFFAVIKLLAVESTW